MKKFKVLTTSTVTRRYVVEAENKEQVEEGFLALNILSEEIIDTEDEVEQLIKEID